MPTDKEKFVVNGCIFTKTDLDQLVFLGYREEDVTLLTRLHDPAAKAEPGFITDEYGIRTRTANLWPAMQPHDGAKAGFPMPGNFHWEAVEWIGLLKSVLSAGDRYRIMELGAGWGPASISGAVLARLKGIKDIYSLAVEADPYHVLFVQQHAADNSIPAGSIGVVEAAVGVENGQAEWPDNTNTAVEYGNRPINSSGDYLGRNVGRTRTVRIVAIHDLLKRDPQWDMLHLDIQGMEGEVLSAAIEDLNQRVAWVCVGTHSRRIDADLIDLFIRHGWVMEHEKPTRMTYVPDAKTLEAMNSGDGTQVWRNPRLRPQSVV